MQKEFPKDVTTLEDSVSCILESLGDDFSWSGFTACDCGKGPVDCCMPADEEKPWKKPHR